MRYKMYIPLDKVVVVTQHVQNAEAPQHGQDGRKIYPDTARPWEDPRSNHRTCDDEQRNGEKRAKKVRKGLKTTWTRECHGTRSTSTNQLAKIKDDTSAENRDVVNALIGQDPRHYREAMKSEHRDQWRVAMTEELDVLKVNDVW